MPDREKVLNALRCHAGCERGFNCDNCDYIGNGDCLELLTMDAYALLKEQEAVEPEAEMLNEVDRLYRCPKCHKHFFYRKQKYCDQCGQAVKWE